MKLDVVRSVRKRSVAFAAAVLCAAVGFTASSAHASVTIMKLSLSDAGPDVGMSAGILNTADDGNASTVGNQNTAIDYTGFLGAFPDITSPAASASLNGLAAAGPAQQFGNLVVQNYTGGVLNIFDSGNILLLSAVLTNSALTGTVGAPGTGSVFTTGLATPVAGSLLPLIAPGSLSLSMDLTSVAGGSGFTVSNGVLQNFNADGSLTIAADPGAGIPEPATLSLAVAGGAALLLRRKQRSPGRN